jgi:hypothetical protein
MERTSNTPVEAAAVGLATATALPMTTTDDDIDGDQVVGTEPMLAPQPTKSTTVVSHHLSYEASSIFRNPSP